jgi:hypothetical protein
LYEEVVKIVESKNDYLFSLEWFDYQNTTYTEKSRQLLETYGRLNGSHIRCEVHPCSMFKYGLECFSTDDLVIYVLAGDYNAYFGNGGYGDPTLEQCIVGYNNDTNILPLPLFNILGPLCLTNNYDTAFSNNTDEELEKCIPLIAKINMGESVFDWQKIFKTNKNRKTIKIAVISIVSILLVLRLGLFFSKKFITSPVSI